MQKNVNFKLTICTYRSDLNEVFQCFKDALLPCFEGECSSIITQFIPEGTLQVRTIIVLFENFGLIRM